MKFAKKQKTSYKKLAMPFLIASQLFLINNSVSAQKINQSIFEKQNSKQQENTRVIIEAANDPKNTIVKEIIEMMLLNLETDELLKKLNITVIATECNKENAFYDPQKKQIIVCYELLHKYMELGKEVIARSKILDDLSTEGQMEAAPLIERIMAIIGFSFVFQHEVGHAVIDIYKIPVFAAEEQVADSFAIVNTIDELDKLYPSLDEFRSVFRNKEQAVKLFLEPIAAQYMVQSVREQIVSSDYANEHPLDIQRFYNIACLIYGSSPTSPSYQYYKQILGSRASRCPNEYKQALENWKKVGEQIDKETSGTNPPVPKEPNHPETNPQPVDDDDI